MEKKLYNTPEMEIVEFGADDVIATSAPGEGENELPVDPLYTDGN